MTKLLTTFLVLLVTYSISESSLLMGAYLVLSLLMIWWETARKWINIIIVALSFLTIFILIWPDSSYLDFLWPSLSIILFITITNGIILVFSNET